MFAKDRIEHETNDWQEEYRYKVFNLLGQMTGQAVLLRHDDANDESSKDGMNADDRGHCVRQTLENLSLVLRTYRTNWPE